MKKYLFVFDLDATITKKEILPLIAEKIGIEREMEALTELAMRGEIDFENSFNRRVLMLKDIPVSEIQKAVREIPLNIEIANFIKQNRDRCRIVTGNLDVWIEQLILKLEMQDYCFSSKGIIENDRLISVSKIVDKEAVVKSFNPPFIAIGDGHNDLSMIKAADIGVGFGGVREIAPSVVNAADYTINSELELCELLYKFV